MERRLFLKGLGVLGCSAAAHPLMTTLTLAQGAPGMGENRLVVVILRGAMDGLDVVQPRGDAGFQTARPGLSALPATDLDGFYALHGSLSGLMPLWQSGELGFVHATSTPYRDKRSHFDGQDLLEAGTGMDVAPGALRDGWLNRMLQAVPGLQAETAYAVGREALPILAGSAAVTNWAPDQRLALTAQGRLLLDHVYHDDALFRDTVEEAFAQTAGGAEKHGADTGDVDMIVDFAAERLRGDTRIAAFSQTGWDTHKGQSRAIKKPLERLQHTILRMKEQLGPDVWGKTTLLAMTEFGRTVRENGSEGTDHGTGGVMLMAGGAVRGGRVYGRWPGLAEADLYDRRDLLPTTDVRAWAAHAMRGLYGFDRGVLERSVFPGLDMGDDPGLLL
jgi:uncharacterized protein (DUF1501 family)